MRMLLTFALVSLTLFGAGLTPAYAETPKPSPMPPSPKPQRVVFPIQNNDATALAEMAGKLFKGEAEVFASPSGNAILIVGPQASVEEALKLIEILDRAPRAVEVEITLVELPRRDGSDLTPAELAKANELVKSGSGQRITITAVEGHPVVSTTGGNKPVVSGTTTARGFGGPDGARGGPGGVPATQKLISYQSIGTTIQLTAKVVTNDAITLDLNVQDSKVRPPESGDDTGMSAMESVSLTTKLLIQPGKTVVARTVKVEGKAGATVAVVLVSARVAGSMGKK